MHVDEVAELASQIAEDVYDILLQARSKSGKILYDPNEVLSDDCVIQVIQYAQRDLARIDYDQESKVSVSKYLGYIAFWFSKLKPINSVHVVSDEHSQNTELLDVNERVAIILIERLFWRIAYADENMIPALWKQCKIESCVIQFNGKKIKGLCFKNKVRKFLEAYDRRYHNYLTYGLRFRAVGPYFLVSYIDQALFFACEQECPPSLINSKVSQVT